MPTGIVMRRSSLADAAALFRVAAKDRSIGITMPATLSFDGGCHCGAVAFTFRAARPPERWEARACQCSFCRSHGARSTADPDGDVVFRIPDPASLQRYRFGSKRTDFLICRRCGVYVAAVIATPRGRFATLNLNALDAGRRAPDATPVSYEGESAKERLARRELRWTPVIGGT